LRAWRRNLQIIINHSISPPDRHRGIFNNGEINFHIEAFLDRLNPGDMRIEAINGKSQQSAVEAIKFLLRARQRHKFARADRGKVGRM